MEENKIELVMPVEAPVEAPIIAIKPEETKEYKIANKLDDTENDDIFITEDNIFSVNVSYYKKGDGIVVEGVDDAFSKDEACKTIEFTFKFPSQGDVNTIYRNTNSPERKSAETMTIKEFSIMEVARFICLIRKWSIKKEITNKNIMELSPKIIKAVLNKVREKIGVEGIL